MQKNGFTRVEMYSKQLSNQRDFSFILMILVVLPLNGQLLDTGALSTK